MLEAAVIVLMFISISNLLGYIFLQKPAKDKTELEELGELSTNAQIYTNAFAENSYDY